MFYLFSVSTRRMYTAQKEIFVGFVLVVIGMLKVLDKYLLNE